MDGYKMAKIFLFSVLFFAFAASGQCQDVAGPGAGQISDKITLDIKGMDILDVLKILSMKSGLNIVAGKNVTGRVTIYLKDVNVWDALQIVLVANNLAYEKQGNIINIMTDRDYELIYGEKFYDKKRTHIVKLKYAKATEVSKALMQVKTNIGKVIVDEGSNTLVLVDIPASIFQMKELVGEIDAPTETKVFSLKYAKAEDIEKKITELVTKNLGIIKVDARTNKLAVTDMPEQLEKIEKMITAFDQKDAQVMIEAKILDITLSDEFKMGIDWDVIAHKYFKLSQTLKANLTEGATIKIGTIAGGANPQVEGDYSSLLNVLRTVGTLNVLSAPRIMALNNQESKILVGTKEAYITSSTSQGGAGTTVTSQSVNFVDTGIKLYVTPTINEDGFITMKIKPEISSAKKTTITADDKKSDIPIVSTSETETTIMVKDGTTIVMAGLIKDSQNKELKKIPLLGDVPLIGKIFSSDSDTKEKREIVILLTPHIVSGESTFAEVEKWQRQETMFNKLRDTVEEENEQIRLKKEKEEILQRKAAKRQKAEFKKGQEKLKKEREIAKPVKPQETKKQPQPVVEREQEKVKPIKAEDIKVSLRLDAQRAAMKEAAFSRNDYDSYFLNMKKKIYDNIRANFSGAGLKGEGTVSFIVDANGNLQADPLIISEDNKDIGDALSEAIRLASPFANFPSAFDAQSEKFTVSVSFK